MLVTDDFVIYTYNCLSPGRRGAVRVLSPLYWEPLPPGKPCEPSSRLPNKDTGAVWRQGPRGERERERGRGWEREREEERERKTDKVLILLEFFVLSRTIFNTNSPQSLGVGTCIYLFIVIALYTCRMHPRAIQ